MDKLTVKDLVRLIDLEVQAVAILESDDIGYDVIWNTIECGIEIPENLLTMKVHSIQASYMGDYDVPTVELFVD